MYLLLQLLNVGTLEALLTSLHSARGGAGGWGVDSLDGRGGRRLLLRRLGRGLCSARRHDECDGIFVLKDENKF